MWKARIGLMLLLVLLAPVVALAACGTKAPSYPQKPVNMMVAFAAGGPVDVAARALVESTKPYLPQPITIINKDGGGGTVGTAEMIQAKPDGYYTGLLTAAALTSSPQTTQTPYKGPGDVEPVIGIVDTVQYFIVKADAPWKTMKELVDYARANPGKIRVGSSGVATSVHIQLESLKIAAGIDLTHVPFGGAGPALTAVLGGHVEANITSGSTGIGHMKAGTARILGVFSDKRAPLLPDIPTMKEMGIDAVSRSGFWFVAAPKGTPKDVTNVLRDAFSKGIKTDAFQKYANDSAYTVTGIGPEEISKTLESDYAWFTDFYKKVKLQ